MGFAKPSVWLALSDEDFNDRFGAIFAQHVEFGSTGKAFIKAFKREREANMLWRVKLKEKLSQGAGASPAPLAARAGGGDDRPAKKPHKPALHNERPGSSCGAVEERCASVDLRRSFAT